MTIDHRTPSAATYDQDHGGYIEAQAGEVATLEYDRRLNQVRMIFFTQHAAEASKRFYADAEVQHYLSAKKRLISRVRSVMREHSPARG